jgi:hypothetical protein
MVAHPRDEALVGAVHRLAAGDELEEEDAEGEHVRLLVHDAVREVLRRQAPVTLPRTEGSRDDVVHRVSVVANHGLTKSKETGAQYVKEKKSLAHPNVPSMGAMAWCVHSDGSHRARPKSEICASIDGVSHGVVDGQGHEKQRRGDPPEARSRR